MSKDERLDQELQVTQKKTEDKASVFIFDDKRINCMTVAISSFISFCCLEPDSITTFVFIFGFLCTQICAPLVVNFLTDAIKQNAWKDEKTRLYVQSRLRVVDYAIELFYYAIVPSIIILGVLLKSITTPCIFLFQYFEGVVPANVLSVATIGFIIFTYSLFPVRFFLRKVRTKYRQEVGSNS